MLRQRVAGLRQKQCVLHPVLHDHGGSFLAHHHLQQRASHALKHRHTARLYHWSVRVAAAQRWHYRCIRDAQALHSQNAQALVDYGGCI
jgi:hypothetical protein